MATTQKRLQSHNVELPRPLAKVPSKDYREYTDVALDSTIVSSVHAAHSHYDGLRRELVSRLLPALSEMRRRYASQGARNDLLRRLGLPTRAGWEDYLQSRGLKPDTVRSWFRQHTAAQTLGLLVGGSSKQQQQQKKLGGTGARLFRVTHDYRVMVVAASSERQAAAIVSAAYPDYGGGKVKAIGQILDVTGIPMGRIINAR
jgi:hypothetical protein